MKHYKKLIIAIILVAFIGTPWYFYHKYQGGTYYYTKITREPININDATDDRGITQGSIYTYNLPSVDKDGKEKEIEFEAYKDKPLKQDAYLKIKVNDIKGVLSWEEVNKYDLPTKAKESFS